MHVIIIVISLLLGGANFACAGEVFSGIPDKLDTTEGKYIVYSHGRIVEGTDPRPIHSVWGLYDFPAVKKELSEPDFTVIALHRPSGIKAEEHSRRLVALVKELISKGIEPNQITMVGFSLGGYITALASNKLEHIPINTIIMATCSDWQDKETDVKLNGNVLSIYEISDGVGSCKTLADRSDGMLSYKEIAINTGKGHGAFYKPRIQWIAPVKDWINKHSFNNGDT